jgi:hypothetical protein
MGPYIKLVVAVGPVLCFVVGAWVKARFSGSVWLKVGLVEVKARATAEVRTLPKESGGFQQCAHPHKRRNGGVMESRTKLIRKKEPKL